MRFDTYVLVAYSTVGGLSAGNMAAGYWVQGITETQEKEEELQPLGLTKNHHESSIPIDPIAIVIRLVIILLAEVL